MSMRWRTNHTSTDVLASGLTETFGVCGTAWGGRNTENEKEDAP